jgi:hypothetical protein
MSSHGLAGEELTKRRLNARTSKQNGNCNAKLIDTNIAIHARDGTDANSPRAY